jgi:hypothetical protein
MIPAAQERNAVFEPITFIVVGLLFLIGSSWPTQHERVITQFA